MADLDTRSKRASSVQILLPIILAPILPDGTIGEGDRQHAVHHYSGISALVSVNPRTLRLYERTNALGLETRTNALGLYERTAAMSLKNRTNALTLYERTNDLTLEDREP